METAAGDNNPPRFGMGRARSESMGHVEDELRKTLEEAIDALRRERERGTPESIHTARLALEKALTAFDAHTKRKGPARAESDMEWFRRRSG